MERQVVRRNPPKWSLWLRGLDEWLLIFQKVSGAILAIYLIGHVLLVSTALGYGRLPTEASLASNWSSVIGLIEGPRVIGSAHVGTIIEYLIALLAAVHGANGFRLILMQYFGIGLPRPERHTYPMIPSPRKPSQMAYKYIVVAVVLIFLILATLVAFVW